MGEVGDGFTIAMSGSTPGATACRRVRGHLQGSLDASIAYSEERTR